MQKNTAFVMRNLYGKFILMPVTANATSEDPILLNDVANDIWEMADNDMDITAFSQKVNELYGLADNTPEAIAVYQFIQQMIEMGLLIPPSKEVE